MEPGPESGSSDSNTHAFSILHCNCSPGLHRTPSSRASVLCRCGSGCPALRPDGASLPQKDAPNWLHEKRHRDAVASHVGSWPCSLASEDGQVSLLIWGTCHRHWIYMWARAIVNFPSLPVGCLRLTHSPVCPEGWSVSLKSPLAKGGLVPRRRHPLVAAPPWPEGGRQRLSAEGGALAAFLQDGRAGGPGGPSPKQKRCNQTTESAWNARTDS